MQLPFIRSRYSSLPLAIDSGVDCTGFFVLSASSGSSQVFFEKSCSGCCWRPGPAPDGGMIERFSFLFDVVGLFVFCESDIEPPTEATITTAAPANSKHASTIRLLRIVSVSPSCSSHWLPGSLFGGRSGGRLRFWLRLFANSVDHHLHGNVRFDHDLVISGHYLKRLKDRLRVLIRNVGDVRRLRQPRKQTGDDLRRVGIVGMHRAPQTVISAGHCNGSVEVAKARIPSSVSRRCFGSE